MSEVAHTVVGGAGITIVRIGGHLAQEIVALGGRGGKKNFRTRAGKVSVRVAA